MSKKLGSQTDWRVKKKDHKFLSSYDPKTKQSKPPKKEK